MVMTVVSRPRLTLQKEENEAQIAINEAQIAKNNAKKERAERKSKEESKLIVAKVRDVDGGGDAQETEIEQTRTLLEEKTQQLKKLQELECMYIIIITHKQRCTRGTMTTSIKSAERRQNFQMFLQY